MKSRSLPYLLKLSTALIPAVVVVTPPALSNPVDGQVVAGEASISAPDPATLLIQQQTNSAIINWQSFNIDAGELTEFHLLDSNGVTLNRVVGSQDPSRIYGTLKSNGTVMLVNPDGILFGEGSVVDVGGLLATTSDIDNDAFMAGSRTFNKRGKSSASVVNEGTITVNDAGIAALVAPGVRNDGLIAAKLGRVTLGAANTFTLDLYGDDLIKLDLDDELTGDVYDAKTGAPLADKVKNTGTIKAEGGLVALKAATARKVVNSVINNEGVIEANTVGTKNGKIVLSAATATTKNAGAPLQKVKVSGVLHAKGTKPGENGGKIYVAGETIETKAAKIDASGISGGGTIAIGGDYLGGRASEEELRQLGIAWEEMALLTSTVVAFDDQTSINASAIDEGNGGKIVAWADEALVTGATITAKGGTTAGNGGFIETSGKYLSVHTAADASASNGKAGTWLLDPLDIRIKNAPDSNYNVIFDQVLGSLFGNVAFPTGSASVISVATVEAALDGGSNVRVTTRGTSGSGQGNIYVENDIIKSAGGEVTVVIDAAKNVIFSPGVDIVSNSGALWLNVFASNGSISGTSLGEFYMNGGGLFLDGRDGITFKSAFDMPDYLGIQVDYDGPSPLSLVNVDVVFGNDTVKFSHNNTTATIPTNGIRLVDASASSFLDLYFGGLNVAFSDYALRSDADHGWYFSLNATSAFGAVSSQALNGKPEIVHGNTVTIIPTTFNAVGIAPVFEADADNPDNCFALTCFATGPEGQALIDRYLSPSPLATIIPATNTKVANSTPMMVSLLPQHSIGTPPDLGSPGLNALAKDILQAYHGSTEDFDLISANVEYAKLANAAYAEPIAEIKSELGRAVPGWQVVNSHPSLEFNSLSATTFQNPNGEIVIAFRGTDPIEDWITNISLGISKLSDIPRLREAYSYALEVKSLFPGAKITVVGHSLGGAIAQYVASELNVKAVTFDPAPLMVAAIRDLNTSVLKHQNITNFRGVADPLTRYVGPAVVGDITTVANTASLRQQLASIDKTFSVARYNHSMSNLLLAMEAVRLINSKMKSTAASF